jgi:hypothetical protein
VRVEPRENHEGIDPPRTHLRGRSRLIVTLRLLVERVKRSQLVLFIWLLPAGNVLNLGIEMNALPSEITQLILVNTQSLRKAVRLYL